MNDLETAAIACEMAERLDAHAIVNHGLDRAQVRGERGLGVDEVEFGHGLGREP